MAAGWKRFTGNLNDLPPAQRMRTVACFAVPVLVSEAVVSASSTETGASRRQRS